MARQSDRTAAKLPPAEELERLHKSMTVKEIAEKFNVSVFRVSNALTPKERQKKADGWFTLEFRRQWEETVAPFRRLTERKYRKIQ